MAWVMAWDEFGLRSRILIFPAGSVAAMARSGFDLSYEQ